jgi:hypothetical protein
VGKQLTTQGALVAIEPAANILATKGMAFFDVGNSHQLKVVSLFAKANEQSREIHS